jgi:hypothetical protein
MCSKLEHQNQGVGEGRGDVIVGPVAQKGQMKDRPTALTIRNRITRANRILAKSNASPGNNDRALRGELAAISFASVTGLNSDIRVDPETVLTDLLADLMHWCDVEANRGSSLESLSFESALKRARGHYRSEHDGAKARGLEDPHSS